MALFAGPAGIMTGEELTYDYNFDNFNKEAVTVCRCGSGECRGFLGKKLSEQEVKRRLKEARSKAEREAAEEAKRQLEEQQRLAEGKKRKKSNWRGYAAVDDEGNLVDREEWEKEREELEAADVEGETGEARPSKRARLIATVSRKGKDGMSKSRSVLRKKALKL